LYFKECAESAVTCTYAKLWIEGENWRRN